MYAKNVSERISFLTKNTVKSAPENANSLLHIFLTEQLTVFFSRKILLSETNFMNAMFYQKLISKLFTLLFHSKPFTPFYFHSPSPTCTAIC